MEDEFKFEVGSTYQNVKGHYEVVSIHGEAMVIRWDDGNEVETTVDQQKRIIERLKHEELVKQQEKEKEKKKKKKTTSTKKAAKKS